ncbi:MAG: polyhydroxybutyrate depolymerase [Myxococcota bacterium]|jgi:polyhydroxybutyrate depolymerase
MRALSLLVILAGCGAAEDDPKPTDTSSTQVTDDPRWDASTWPTEVGGGREADVRAPASWDGKSRLPVLFVLHGYGANAAAQDLYFQATARVETDQVIVVLPDGKVDEGGSRFWNAASACCDFYGDGVDDVAYLTRLLDEVEESFPVDPERVYLVGHSNGGFMAHRLACELGGRITAYASLAGGAEDRECASGVASVLQLHGTADDTIPFDTNGWTLGAEDSVQLAADRAGCTGTEAGGRADYLLDTDGDETVITRWSGCDAGFKAELWAFEGGGHIPLLNEASRDAMYGWLFAE